MQIKDLGRIVTGKTPSSKSPEDFGEHYPFITPTDMGSERFVETSRGISQNGFSKFKRQIIPKHSICFVSIGATIGKICMTHESSLTNQQINSIVVDQAKADPFFVYYLLSTYGERVKSLAGGAATPIVNKTTFEKIEIDVPSLPIQRKIAAILSAYDGLIENNTRRIAILEEMAQRIYREWFVHFRYPGHENDSLVDSGTELGMIPSGWEVTRIDESSRIIRGRSYKSAELNSGLPFVTLKSIERNGGYRQDGLKKYSGKYKSEQVIGPNSIIIAVTDMTQDRAIIGRAARIPDVGISEYLFSMDLVSIIPYESVGKLFLYGWLRYTSFGLRVKEYANGANVLHLLPDRIAEQHCCVPPPGIVESYETDAHQTYTMIDNLLQQNTLLKRTRNLLLPKLISGQIDVNELDINIEVNPDG